MDVYKSRFCLPGGDALVSEFVSSDGICNVRGGYGEEDHDH